MIHRIHRHIVLVLYALLGRSCLFHAYLIQCPHISQWNYSVESFQQCFPATKYLCLYNTLQHSYEEKCGIKEEKTRNGKYVLSPNPDKRDCSPEYYQPFIFTSFGNSLCVYKKSTCNEEGQIIATNGSTKTDRTCMCDYTKNYVYITPPNDICSCKPSEEDCSCYLRPCTGKKQIMISDYRCVPKDRKPLPEQMKCLEITTSSPAPSAGTVTTPVVITSNKDFSDTSTGAKGVSVIIMFFVVLFVILGLVISVNVRPHVTTTEVVYMEDLIVTKNYGKSITVIEGEWLEIKCEYTSKLPVKSVTCQQRKLDANVQSVNSMQDPTSSLTSPLIIDNISSKHSGRYECILTNSIGLSNTTYDHCPKFCNILRYLPACRPEEMNCVDINVCSLPNEYKTISVLKGKDGILEINEKNYTRVMWFTHGEKLTSIKPTDKFNEPTDRLKELTDKYNKYTHSKPSLTIKAVKFSDVGRYVCVLVDGQGKVESKGFRLRVIPQEKIYNQVLQHRNDQTYVKTGDVDKVNTCLQQYGTVVLSGRAGTGKSKLCLEIASLCEENDCLPYVVDVLNKSPEDFGHSKILCIIDCNGYNVEDPEQLKTLLSDLESRENVQILVTSRSTDLINVQTILQESKVLKEGNMIDLDKSLTSEEKKDILNKHMEAKNKAESSSEEILVKDERQVKIDTKTIEEIIKTEPLHGFPQTVVDFCKDRKLDKKRFTNLPGSLETEIYTLAKMKVIPKKGVNSQEVALEQRKRMKFCVLVYIATDEKKCMDVRDINTKRFTDLYQVLYRTDISVISSEIKDTVKDLAGQFLIDKGGKYEFVHGYVLTTIYVSHEFFTYYLIQKGSFSEIKELIRSSKYKCKGEMVCKWCRSDYRKYITLCKRLLTHAAINANNAKDVGKYIYDRFIKEKDDEFRCELISFSLLESRIYTEKSPPTKMGRAPKIFGSVREPVSEEPIETTDEKDTGPKISFWQTVVLIDELTDHGKDAWVLLQKKGESGGERDLLQKKGESGEERNLLQKKGESEGERDLLQKKGESGEEKTDIILLCGLIVTCLGKRQDDEFQNHLIDQFESQCKHESFLKTLMQRLDIYGNTFFHYLVIFMEEESHSILKKLLSKDKHSTSLLSNEKHRSIFGQTNKMNLTPLDMAAYLGKLKLFLLLLVNTKKEVINKNKEHLHKLTEEGRMTADDKEDKKMSLNFEESLVRYIKYGEEKDFLDILDLHKKTKLKIGEVRKWMTS